ncbi:MAG: DUF1697 domain-containing protein [Flavobacteriales bacterium]|nr:DUF1697 domain-containing protein [Flavobacteriales bacterium]
MALTTYILLFRGVGGPVQLPVAELRAALTKAGFKDATTYINSGNALVRSALDRERTIATVADICRKKFHYDRPIFAPTAKEWEAVIANNPFPQAVATPKWLHASLLAGDPDPAKVKAVLSFAENGEQLKVVRGVAYIHTPNGFGTSKMAAKFDKGIGVVNTARNWNTVLKLQELARGMESDGAGGF